MDSTENPMEVDVMTWRDFLQSTMEKEEALHLLQVLKHRCCMMSLLLKLGVIYSGETDQDTLEDLIHAWARTNQFTYGTLLRMVQSHILNERDVGDRIEKTLQRHYTEKVPLLELLI